MPKNEFREYLLKVLAEARLRGIQVLVDSDLFEEASDLFEPDEIEGLVIEMAEKQREETDDDEDS